MVRYTFVVGYKKLSDKYDKTNYKRYITDFILVTILPSFYKFWIFRSFSFQFFLKYEKIDPFLLS